MIFLHLHHTLTPLPEYVSGHTKIDTRLKRQLLYAATAAYKGSHF